MRNTVIVFLFLWLISCESHDKFKYRIFKLDEATILSSIDSVYNKHPQYKAPNKWTIYNSYSVRGSEFARERRFYFLPPNEEMYYVTILPYESETKVIIGAVHTGSGWYLEKDLSPGEIKRIEKRFDTKI